MEDLPQIEDPESLIQILRHGDYLRHSKQDIVSLLSSDKSDTEKAEYVRSAYPPFLFAEFYKQGTEDHLGYRAAEDGLLLYEGKFTTRKAEVLMEWPFVAQLIGALIKDRNYLDEPRGGEQLPLLDVDTESGQTKEEIVPDTSSQMRIPQEVIDDFLRLGGCIRNSSQRIYGFYRRANNQAENVAFLKSEYEQDSVGIVVDNRNYAVKWDENGVRISTGDRVSDVSSILLPWEYIDKRIRELLEAGQYLPRNEAEKADEIWETYVADKVAFLYREDYENIPKEYKTTSSFLWPEINNFYREILRDTENLSSFIEEMLANEERVKEYPGRFRRFYDGKKIAGLVSTFLRDPIDFPQADPHILPPKQFVTQDKIDAYLTERGTPYSDGKLAIYPFFLRNKDTKERASFLAKSYGIGGSGGSRIDTTHDGKGLALYGGLQHWKDGVLLKWPQVAKRVDELIKQGKYLNDREKQELDRYERKIVSERIRVFYSRKGKDFLLPYADHGITGYWEDVADLQEQIQSKERLAEIVEGMQTVLESLIPGGDDYARESYERDKQVLEDVKNYLAGKFNIFPNSPYRLKTPFAPEKAEPAQVPVMHENEPVEENMPDTEYDLKLGMTVYIGKDEMEILSLAGDTVELFDGTLIPLELDFDTFMKRLRENGLNDGLKKQTEQTKEPVESDEDAVARVIPQGDDVWGKYEQMKKQFPDHIVMVRVGDFFEFFEDDAVKVSDALELTLTGRAVAGKPTRVPMCGIPYHKESDYVKKLIDKGFKVAIDGGEELIQKGNEQPINEEKKYSPLGRRYLEAQKEYPDHLVMMLVLDSYEFYGEDAKVLSDVAGLELTSRDIMGIGEVPMCKFRVHQTNNYLQKLLDAGHSVVICDSTSMKPVKATTVKERTHSDAEIARILPDKGSDILRLYENRFSDDRFYVDTEKGEVRWLYFNPDSTSKGQFIENIVTFEQIVEHKDNMDYSVFFDKLGSEAKQYIVDSDDEEFKDAAYHYLTDECTFRGLGTAARKILISTAEEKEMADMEESPNRFSIRRIPHEGGRVAIWDGAIKKYVGGNRQIYLFVDQNDAIKHLAKLQREHGIPEAVIFTTEKGKSYHIGDTLFTSFENNDGGVHIEIERVDEYDVWYTMPSEPGQQAVNMDRGIFEKYLDTGNITVLFSEHFVPDRTPGDIEADKAEVAELTVVSRFLHATRMDDIDVYFDVGEIVARDGGNEWRGKALYEFLLNDVTTLDENLHLVEGMSIKDEILTPVIELAKKYGADITSVQSREEDELERAKDYIREYLIREFDEREDHFEDLSKIELAYTTVSDADIPVQTEVDLEKYELRMYLRDVLVETIRYNTLKEMNDNLLCGLDFGGLTEVTDDQIEQYWRESRKEIPQLAEEPKPGKSFPVYNSHPEIPDSEKNNYRITNNEIGMGGAKAKFRKNIDAIKLLYQLEAEDRLATPEEQEILAQYSGWGGLADAFDSTKDNWRMEYNELKNLLSPEEYEAANESTLTAFYTPPTVIRAMYDALENMGFKRGNILEPSCGVGNFMGLLPESMDAKMYGVELDSLSGRIARQLYQKNGITIDGYEKTHFPDSFFDVAIGNVPFNDFKLLDKKYDKYNFLIHDYFFAKTLDKVRPGGVIAFITSSGTLDKENPSVRKYISQRADFLGAIRLPNNTFDGAGANKVVSDIIFLQKRDRIVEREEDWVHLGVDKNGIRMNQYFIDNPDMVLGEMVMRSGPYGPEPTCQAYEDEDLGELLAEAVSNIHAEIGEVEIEELSEDGEDKSIPADPTVKNFSFTIVDGKVYYRQNSVMNPVETSVTGENRIKGMIGIRDTVKALIEAQLEDYPESEIKELQSKLNRQYDEFTAKYGLINSRGNAAVFSDDNSYFLLCSLEILDENKELKAKADMFTKRTIKPQVTVDRVDTASEALALSMGERAMVDMEYMSELTGKNEEELFVDLKGVIFRNPEHGDVIGAKPYLMADEYLAGNVREKLKQAREKAESDPEFAANVEALEKVQPEDLSAAEIGVRLGTTWIPESDVQAFVYELLGTSFYARRHIRVKYIPQTAQWVISNKTRDIGNVKADNAYGTHRINAYEIIEQTLNLKDVRIFDYVYDANGNKQAILNKKETAIAQGKQELIKRAFDEWIWKDPARRERLCKLYNERFNSIRPREFDGSHIKFYGMNPEITLRKHQSDAVARIMYGGNSLLAHVVGAGKTFTMVAAAQESKRLGLCSKSMFVVPNHLIEQWASEYLQLYPSANILVATKKDFETKNRKKFCARIATGDYDAVIIGHSQFEKIPMSLERQIETLNKERDEILQSMEEIQESRGDRITTKQLAKAKKQIETKLKKLNDQSRKDDVVTFEELGVDRLFVDEAHFYKNLAAYTKMRNVAGISQTEAQKSSDLYMKCRYLDELTGGKGCVFATGTPISNTMVELYTMQKYLQYDELQLRGLLNFDSWASTFGETVTAIELAPDGSGYRAKTRFAKFFNIPELMAMFKQTADIQTADMLNLPVPEAHYHIVKVEASDVQKKLVESFAERAEKVHNRLVDSSQDNMLLITNDGRKAALDQRLINTALGDYDGSKVNTCVENIYKIWVQTTDKKSAQLVFCDLSTPKGDGSFNVYDDIRQKLIAKGIPADEIEFIHNADSDAKKKELFAKVRRGQIRVLMGSTFKMGAGTNVQQRLIALHDLDVPWRPADLEQRAGRIVRQGNTNPEVDLYRYVTEGTFDAYSYQLLESKQKFISQVMTSKSPVRSAEDVDETALSYAEIKALASGNPKIMEKMQLDADVAKLKLMKADYLSQRYGLEDAIIKHFPRAIAEKEEKIRGVTADIETALNRTIPDESGFSPMVIMGKTYTDKADAGKEILAICERITNPEARPLGEYRGFQTDIGFDTGRKEFFITLRGALYHKVPLGTDAHGIITRLDNAIEKFDMNRQTFMAELGELHRQEENAKAEIAKPFPDEAVLEEKSRRLAELNAELDMDRQENEILDGPEEDERDEHNRRRDERNNR